METQDVMSGYLTCLFKALAMDLAMLVLPTPGGPQKHKMLSGYLTCLFKALAMGLAMLVLPTPWGPWKHKMICLIILPAYLKPWLWIWPGWFYQLLRDHGNTRCNVWLSYLPI